MVPSSQLASSMLRPVSLRAIGKLPLGLYARSLATPSSSKPSFSQTLDGGPSLDDFISGSTADRVVLGNTSQYVAYFSVRSIAHCNIGLYRPRLPSFLKTSIPKGASFAKIKQDLRGLGLHTVCEEARCPNIGDCWGGKEGVTEEEGKKAATATIMVRLLDSYHFCTHSPQ